VSGLLGATSANLHRFRTRAKCHRRQQVRGVCWLKGRGNAVLDAVPVVGCHGEYSRRYLRLIAIRLHEGRGRTSGTTKDNDQSKSGWFNRFRGQPLIPCRAYYHRTTFLQLNTITFLLLFPNPFIPSELSGSERNDSNSMYAFYLKTFCPLFIVIGRRRFWTYLFAICRTAGFKVRPCIPKRHATEGSGPTVTRLKQDAFRERRLKL
jgi:hypothetical protein